MDSIFGFCTFKLVYMVIFNFLAQFFKFSHFWLIFRLFRPKNQPNVNFSEKMTSVSFKPLLTSNFRHSINKIIRADFEIKLKKSIFGLFLGFFPKNQPNQIFYEKSGSIRVPGYFWTYFLVIILLFSLKIIRNS